ncbi:unnamed protein product, partial [Callosobruchus maculatus]
MVYLTEMHKIIILQMIGYGDNTRTQKEVARSFHEKFPNLPAVSQGTISNIEKQFRELGYVRQIRKMRAHLHFTVHVNRQNCRYWTDENPHWMREEHTQYPQKVNVWAGIVGNHIVGPFFIDGNLNGDKYLELLQNYVVPTLANLHPDPANPQVPANTIWFQQDGAPPHYQMNVRQYLNQIFPNRWIGRRGSMEWPARSPDL